MGQLTVQEFSKALAAKQNTFKSVLPAHIPPEKFMRTAVGAVQNNPDILKCSQSSIFQACQKAAQDGLVLDNREAALVSFGSQAQYMPMVAGVLKKLRNSGNLSTIVVEIVHKNDPFTYNPGTGEFNHEPDWFGDRGEAKGVYAMATLKDGSRQIEIMNKQQLNQVKAVSRSSGAGPWKQWEHQMWKKSVLRRIAKLLPSSADIDQMWENDNDNYDYDTPIADSGHYQPATAQDINANLNSHQPPPEPTQQHDDAIDVQATVVPDDQPPI